MKSNVLTLPIKFPSLNDYIAAMNRNRFIGNTMKRNHTQYVSQQAEAQGLYPMEGAVNVRIDWREATSRRDPDNIVFAKKFILDGLVEAGILPNDTQEYIKQFRESWSVNKDNPGVTVTLEEVEQ